MTRDKTSATLGLVAALLVAGAGAAWYALGHGLDTSAAARVVKDLPYATGSAAQKLDLYLPKAGTAPYPVIVEAHGGGFALGSKSGAGTATALKALERGYAVASIDYRLSGEAKFPAQIQDAKAAVRFLRANAATYGLDPERFAAWGGSAGGNIVSLLGTSSGVAELEDLSQGNARFPSSVRAVVDQFGPTDFLAMTAQDKAAGTKGQDHDAATSFESMLFGRAIQEIPETVHKANPETYLGRGDAAFLIQHGTADGNVPYAQSVNFAAKIAAATGTGNVEFDTLTGAGHGGAEFETPENVARILDFLDARLGRGK